MSDLLTRYIALCEQCGKLAGISFELTNYCNFSCTHCYRVHGSDFISAEIFYKVIKEAEDLGAIMVSFNGGEPTLHPQFLEFAQHVLRRGMNLSVLTNGAGLTDTVINALSPWCKGVHLQFSLYGTNAQSSAEITGDSSSFEKALKQIFDIKQRGFDLRVALLVLAQTADDLPKLMQKLLTNGIEFGLMPQISCVENGDTAPLKLVASEKQFFRLLNLVGDWRRDLKEPSTVIPDLSERRVACNAAVTSIGIRVDGRILPCQIFNEPVLGRVMVHTLNEVMQSVARQQFITENVVPTACIQCELSGYCMRCPADAMFETGELTGIPQESCRIARLRAKISVDSP